MLSVVINNRTVWASEGHRGAFRTAKLMAERSGAPMVAVSVVADSGKAGPLYWVLPYGEFSVVVGAKAERGLGDTAKVARGKAHRLFLPVYEDIGVDEPHGAAMVGEAFTVDELVAFCKVRFAQNLPTLLKEDGE